MCKAKRIGGTNIRWATTQVGQRAALFHWAPLVSDKASKAARYLMFHKVTKVWRVRESQMRTSLQDVEQGTGVGHDMAGLGREI